MADQVYQLVLSGVVNTQFFSNIMHYRFDDSGYDTTERAANALAVKWNASQLGLFKTMCPNKTTFLSLRARRVTGGQGFESFLPIAAATTGTRAGNTTAAAVGPVAVGFPALPTGRSRARLFIPGIRIDDVVTGTIASAMVTAINAVLTTVFDPIVLAGGGGPTATYVIKKATAAASIPITEWRCSDRIGTIRRRQSPV
jgi:hypothetical protein